MPDSYAALEANKRRQKAALTRARNSGDPHKLLAAARAGLRSFDTYGWPDQWSDWQRAADDAEAKIRYAGHGDHWRRRGAARQRMHSHPSRPYSHPVSRKHRRG